MSETTASLKISVDSRDINKAKSDLDNLSNSSSKTEHSTNKLTSSFKGLGIALSAVTATALAKQFLDTADAMNLLDARLKLLTNSTSEFISQQKIMNEIAKGTYSNIQDITKLYTKLDPALKQIGASTQGVNKVSENFAKSLKLGGASATEASTAIYQFAQAMGSGVLRGDEFNSMAEASPKLMEYMAQGMGVPRTALRKMAEEGKLTADVVASALLKMSEQIEKDFKTLPLVVSAATTNLITDIQNIVHEFDSITGASSSVAESIKELSDSISSNTTFMPTAIQFYYDAKTALIELGYVLGDTGMAFGDIVTPITEAETSLLSFQNSTTGVISFIATMNAALSNSAIMFENAGIEAAQWYKFITFADDADAFINRTNKEIEANRAKIKTLEEIGNAGLEAANKTREAFQLSDEIKNGRELNKIYEDFNSALDDVLETQEFSAEQEIENIAKTSKNLTKKHTATKAEIKEIEKLKKEAQDAENDLAKEGFKIQKEFRDKNHKENKKAFSVINEKTKQQQSDNEAFLKTIQSEADKVNEAYLKIYETQKLIASPEQLEAFYKKWQGAIDDIKPPKDDFQKWGDTLNSSISNALVDALKDGDVMSAVNGLGASISSSMIQSSVSNIASGKGDIMSMQGLGGIATGMAMSGFVSLFDSPKRKTNEEKAQEAFDKFIKGLNDSKIALDNIGNVGSSTGKVISGIQAEMDNLIKQLNIKYPNMAGGTLSRETDFSKVWSLNTDIKELSKLQTELNAITLDGLVKSLDYSKLSAAELDKITSAINIATFKEMEAELNNFALEAKKNGGVLTDAARVQTILKDTNYKLAKDYEAAINIRIKADEDAIAANQAVTDAREYERLSLQQQIDLLTGATTQRDIELAKIDEANRPLQERIWLLQDEANKTEIAIESIKDNINKLSQLDAIYSLTHSALENEAYLRQKALDGMGIEDKARQIEINALKDLESANKNYVDALNYQGDALNKTLSEITSNISIMDSAFDKINNTVTALRASTTTTEASLQSFYESMAETKTLASGTDYAAYVKSLDKTITASSFLLNKDPATLTKDIQFAQLVAANQFEELGIVTLSQTDYLKQIEINTREQIGAILKVVQAMGASTAISNASILAASQASALAAKSAATAANASAVISSAAISAPEALKSFTSMWSSDIVTQSLGTNVGATSKTSGFTSIADIYQNVLGREPDAAGIAYYSDVLARGASLQDIASGVSKDAEALIKGVSSFAVGTPSVPTDMLAKIHQGEMIVPKTFNEAIQSGSVTLGQNNNDAMVRELNILNQKQNAIITILRESNDIHNVNLQINTMIQEAN